VDYTDEFSPVRIPYGNNVGGYFVLPTYLSTGTILQIRISRTPGKQDLPLSAIDFFTQNLNQIVYQASLRYYGDPYPNTVFQSSLFNSWSSPVLFPYDPEIHIRPKEHVVFTFYFDDDRSVHLLIGGTVIGNGYHHSQLKISDVHIVGVFGGVDVDSIILYPKDLWNVLSFV